MGAGRRRKKNTHMLKEKAQPSCTVNCSVSARNLRKSDLGAVIFGCKHNTIAECYSELLFGLPGSHFAYVKNIRPGLPLFLFNYSDRKIHGIFEAVSPGQMNIDPYAWTSDSAGYTPYPAQVRVRIQRQCQPLLEDQYSPVIADNYYEPRMFWQELDRTQTKNLISLFSLSPIDASASQPRDIATRNTNQVIKQRKARRNPFVNALPTSDTKQVLGDVEELVQQKQNCAHTNSSIVGTTSTTTSHQQKTWSSLFKNSTSSELLKEDEDLKREPSELDLAHSNQYNMEWDSSSATPCLEGESQNLEALRENSAMWNEEEVHTGSESGWEVSGSSSDNNEEGSDHPFVMDGVNSKDGCSLEDMAVAATKPLVDKSVQEIERLKDFQSKQIQKISSLEEDLEDEDSKTQTSELNLAHFNQHNMEWDSSSVTPRLEGESQDLEALREDSAMWKKKEVQAGSEPGWELSGSSDSNAEGFDHPFVMDGVNSKEGCSFEDLAVADLVAKLVREIEGLKDSQLEQVQKISSLEEELVESKAEIQQLKNRCDILESGSLFPIGHVQEASIKTIDDSILVVGGFDGCSWLSALDSYSPSQDTMKSLMPMTFPRSYASAATLDGELYIFGGVDGGAWHDTVESYNPRSDQWVSRPSLNQKKGSLAGASLHGKIYAVGGGNGLECYADVEMLDMNIGRWITTRSMLQKRFALAAAEIDGIIYVVGGYDGRNYLNSVERFDPREQTWTRIGSMSTRRGCHSLAVLSAKLYALGGYNGAEMVPTVEIFDPRLGSWMMGEPMINAKGYSGAAVSGGKIYAIGGMNKSDEIFDTIERYEEGCGWEVTNLKAVGKRCFFSAIVL